MPYLSRLVLNSSINGRLLTFKTLGTLKSWQQSSEYIILTIRYKAKMIYLNRFNNGKTWLRHEKIYLREEIQVKELEVTHNKDQINLNNKTWDIFDQRQDIIN